MRIGVLGGGQLGRMLALAGYPLGLGFRFLEPASHAPVGILAELMRGDYDDPRALDDFANGLDRITYEFESIPIESVRELNRRVPVFPPPEALATAQDRLQEKELFNRLDIPTPPFAAIGSFADLETALDRIAPPAVLKTRRLGYDGKGQFVVRAACDARTAWNALGGVPALLESLVAFQREVSILAVRGCARESAFYPLVENHHENGILCLSLAPAPHLSSALQSHAEDYARRVMEALDYVGVLAIEFFECDGRLLANEMAPRVHNSGHWTIEGAETSQFENHLRAILGWPLGGTHAFGCSAMVNLIGTVPAIESIFAIQGAHLHLYGKLPRPGRKLGHVTLWTQDYERLQHQLGSMRALIVD